MRKLVVVLFIVIVTFIASAMTQAAKVAYYDSGKRQIHVLDMQTKIDTVVTSNQQVASKISWSSNGTKLVFDTYANYKGSIWILDALAKKPTVRQAKMHNGRPRDGIMPCWCKDRLTYYCGNAGTIFCDDVIVVKDESAGIDGLIANSSGTIVYSLTAYNGGRNIFTVTKNQGKTKRRFTIDRRIWPAILDLSPNGRNLLITKSTREEQPTCPLYAINVAAKKPRAIQLKGVNSRDAIWQNSQTVLYLRHKSGDRGLYLYNVKTAKTTLVRQLVGKPKHLAFTPK